MQSMYTVPVQRRSQQKPVSATTWLFAGGLVLTIFFTFTVMLFVLGVVIVKASNRLPPGASVMGVSLGGMSVEDAAVELAAAWNTIRVRDESRVWAVSPASLGLTLDSRATAQAVQDKGWSLLLSGERVQPIVTIDLTQAEKGLKALLPTVERAAANATFRYNNGQLIAVAPVEGRQLNVPAVLDRLRTNTAAELADGALDLEMNRIAPSITDATPLIDKARQLLASSLTIQAYSPITDQTDKWTLPAEQWGQWLSIENTPSGAVFSLDSKALTNYLNGQNSALGAERHIDITQSMAAIRGALSVGSTTSTIRVYSAPTSYTVQSGETLGAIAWKVGVPMWRITKANPGINLNVLSSGQRITIPSKDDMLPLPIVPGKRIVVSISKQHMWVYENAQLKWDWVASTGISDSPTMPGIFQVQSHEKNAYGALWDLWMPHFMGIYEAVPGFMNGIHGLPTLSSGKLLWAGVLGRPITYGCVLLSLENATALFSWAQDGVVVEIKA